MSSQGTEFLNKGKDLQMKGDLANAEIYLKQATEYDDSKLPAHEALGIFYLNAGNMMQAIPHWEEALKLDENNFEGLSNLGFYLSQLQRFPEAISYLERAYIIQPERDDLALQLAQIQAQLGNLNKAESYLSPLIKAKSKNENVHLLMAQLKAMSQDIVGAEACLQHLLKIKPFLPEALINLAQLAEGSGNVEKAKEHYEMVLKHVPYHYQTQVEYGRFLSNLGDSERALEMLQNAAKLQPGDWTTYVHLGNLYQELGEFDKAIKAYKKSLSINPNDLGVKQNLSRVLTRFVPPWHLKMLADHERNDAFEEAIKRAVNEDSVVLDIGTGSGILSMMAARAGAQKVYTCETNQYIADAAKENIKKNGYKKQIKLFAKKSSQVTETEIDPKPNLIVAEIFDAGLLGEHAIPSFRHALSQLAQPGTQVIPKAAEVKGKLLHAERQASVNPMKNISGLDFSAFDQFRVAEEYITQNLSEITHEFCSDEFDLMSVDFNNPWEAFAPGQYKWYTVEVPITSDKPIHGVAFWFILHLDDEIRLSSEPGRPDNHWGQAVSFFPEAISAEAGKTMKLPICFHDIKIWFGQPEIH